MKIAIHADFGDTIVLHEGFDQCALFSALLKLGCLFFCESFLWTETHTTFFGLLNAIHLPLCTYLRFELSNGTKHVEQ